MFNNFSHDHQVVLLNLKSSHNNLLLFAIFIEFCNMFGFFSFTFNFFFSNLSLSFFSLYFSSFALDFFSF